MAQQIINIGAAPNDGTGDVLRTAFQKVNDNFTELYGSSSSAALTYTFTGASVVDGAIDLSGSVGLPVSGSIPSGLRVYADDVDYSQSASYTPSTQIVFAGLTGDETEITIKITF